jgi:RNA polymerase sigma-70 factor (ECF subfamily)
VEDVEALADKVEQELFDDKGRWRTPPAKWSAAPDASLETSQLYEVLERCVEGLSPRLAQAFSLREMDDLSTAEICKIMDITATNLGVMMHRARMQLRRCLELGWFAPPDPAEGSC